MDGSNFMNILGMDVWIRHSYAKAVIDESRLMKWVEPKGKHSDPKVLCSNVLREFLPIWLLECSAPECFRVQFGFWTCIHPGTSTMQFAGEPNLLLHDRIQSSW